MNVGWLAFGAKPPVAGSATGSFGSTISVNHDAALAAHRHSETINMLSAKQSGFQMVQLERNGTTIDVVGHAVCMTPNVNFEVQYRLARGRRHNWLQSTGNLLAGTALIRSSAV